MPYRGVSIFASMTPKTRIALIMEGKIPPDRRVAFDPFQCREMMSHFPVDIVVEPSPIRCYTDQEYLDAGIRVDPAIRDCGFYFGIKEVPLDALIPDKTYFFFSHTIKKQPYNRQLLQTILDRGIRLVDYEVLTDDRGQRVAAFGYYAGVVGAHNALYAYGKRTGLFRLPRMKYLRDYAEAIDTYHSMDLPPCRIVVAGGGRVSKGVVRVLEDMGCVRIAPDQFLANTDFSFPVFTVLLPSEYVRRKDGSLYRKEDFYARPDDFESAFAPYAARADIFLNAILWKKGAPAFFTTAEMAGPDFRIQVIGDITCDIAPDTSVPSTIRASTIDDPVFGYDPVRQQEVAPYQQHAVDMMTIDNLPSELPRDAASAFGAQLLESVIPELFLPESRMLERATITLNGRLTPRFEYLRDYVDED